MSKADGYAVVLDDKGSPYGYWFVGAWNTQESAEIALKGQKGNGRIVPLYFRPEGGAMTPSEASNKVLEIRDKTVMSKYASQAECKAARDALWEAACALRWAEQSTPQNGEGGNNG